MRSVIALFCLTLTLGAAVTTEVYWRCGEDGVRPYMWPQDSSGHRRSIAVPTFARGSITVNNTLGTATPPAGSTSYYVGDYGSDCISNSWVNYWLAPSDNVGIEGWVWVTIAALNGQMFGTSDRQHGLGVEVDDTGHIWASISGTQVGSAIAAPATWVHCAVVRSGGVTTFYTNGVACGATSAAIPAATNGKAEFISTDDGHCLQANVDEVRMFTFAAGQFSTADLLCNRATAGAPQVCGIITASQTQWGTNIAAAVGEDVTLSVPVVGLAPMRYYWHGPSGVLGTNASVTVSNLTGAADGNYYLIASNSVGTATSSVSVLSVKSWQTLAQGSAPDSAQRAFMDLRYGTFCHFSINTFLDEDWSDGSSSAGSYAPAAVNADQWVASAWAGGARYFVLTAKHHDGFCLWPSAYTAYSVAASGNTNDVVKLVSEACAKYHLALGIYYSLWDRHEPSYVTNFYPGYAAYMTNQLAELLSNYGPIGVIWFDGNFGDSRPMQDWCLPELYNVIHSIQPSCVVVVNGPMQDRSRWLDWPLQPSAVTNGSRMMNFPMDCWASQAAAYSPAQREFTYQNKGGTYWLPFELSRPLTQGEIWFWKTTDAGPEMLNTLSNYAAVTFAQSNNVMFNIPPNRDGVVPASYTNMLLSLSAALNLHPRLVPVSCVVGRIMSVTNAP